MASEFTLSRGRLAGRLKVTEHTQMQFKGGDYPHSRKIERIKAKLDECQYVKYSTYRVALKLHVLQDYTYMRSVPISIIEGVFERHKLQTNESSLSLETSDLEAVLYDIYFAASKQNQTSFDVDDATEDMLDLLCCIFEKDHRANIQVLSAKLVLGVLSNCSLRQFSSFLFSLCSDHNNCVTRLRLQAVLMKVTELLAFLEEDVIFGQHLIASSVEDCFANSPGLVGINEASFMLWLDKQPQLLSWVSILDKMKATYRVVHSAKCSSCKESPLTGLIYKCLKCTKYVQCQYCFFVGKTSHSHKLSHSMREYSSEKNLEDSSSDIIKKILRMLGCSVRSNSQSVSAAKLHSLRSSYKQYFMKCSSPEYCDIRHLPPQQQLQVIIQQLELQSRHLQMLIHTDHNDTEMMKYLDDHRLHMKLQAQRLRLLKSNLEVQQSPPQVHREYDDCSDRLTKSTPKSLTSCHRLADNVDLFSPILQPAANETDTFFTCHNGLSQDFNKFKPAPKDLTVEASGPYNYDDVSTWIGGQQMSSTESNPSREACPMPNQSRVNNLQTDLDDALAKLQQILANNFCLEEPTGLDNGQLKYAVSEVEGMLTSFIDNVEISSTNSVHPNVTSKVPTEIALLTT